MVDVARAGARRARPVAGHALARVAQVVGGREIAEEVVARVARGRAGLGDALAGDVQRHLAVRLRHGRAGQAAGDRVGVGARAHACDRCCS